MNSTKIAGIVAALSAIVVLAATFQEELKAVTLGN